MIALVTGSNGFIGRHLVERLSTKPCSAVQQFDIQNTREDLEASLASADIVYHLAGVNRPRSEAEFEQGNTGLTAEICAVLRKLGRRPAIVMSSSVQAALDNPYGVSKQKAEDVLGAFGGETGAEIRIFRLKNVFGKWCRPNYNSVVATFCHCIANDLPYSISDPSRKLDLVYVGDVIDAFLSGGIPEIPSHSLTLGELAGRIQAFHEIHTSLLIPDFSVPFNRQLYATYLSYVPESGLRKQLEIRRDNRGSLAEFTKSPHSGQIFVSRTRPGITRGNHYHHTKTEKFLVVEGEGVIRMRHILGSDIREYPVRGEEFQVVDIPPGFTHSIENVGSGEMVTLFWASEIFNPDLPDTYFMPVFREAAQTE